MPLRRSAATKVMVFQCPCGTRPIRRSLRGQRPLGDYARKASSLIEAAPRGASYIRSVAATFDLAIAEAVAQCPAAEALMAYLAQCAPERFPMILVQGAV